MTRGVWGSLTRRLTIGACAVVLLGSVSSRLDARRDNATARLTADISRPGRSSGSDVPGGPQSPEMLPAAQRAAPAASHPSRALVDTYCVGCHNQRAKIGGLALDTVDLTDVSDARRGLGRRRSASCAAG